MCRAIWTLVVAPDVDACKALRRACGADVQVVGMATSREEALDLLGSSRADAVVVDARLPGAAALVQDLGAREGAVVWVGGDPPPGAHHATDTGEGIEDRLPGAITKALIARRSQPPSPPMSTSG